MNLLFKEITLGFFQLQARFLQFLKNNFNVFKVFCFISAEYDDI